MPDYRQDEEIDMNCESWGAFIFSILLAGGVYLRELIAARSNAVRLELEAKIAAHAAVCPATAPKVVQVLPVNHPFPGKTDPDAQGNTNG